MSSTTNYNKKVDNNYHYNYYYTNNYYSNYDNTNNEYIFNNANNNITANDDFRVNDIIYATKLWQKINKFSTKNAASIHF